MGSPVLDKVPKILDPLPGGKSLVNAVDYVVNWSRANSLWPLVFGTSCCAIEMMATGASRHDWARFGVEVARATPRQADLIILAGTIVEKMAIRLKVLYEQMPEPKYVIAMGACTVSGGPFYYDSYSAIKGADRVIPVDVYVPGCPPRPEALLYGIMQLQELIKKESIRSPRIPNLVNLAPIVDTFTRDADAWEAEEKIKDEKLKAEREQFVKDHPEWQAYKHQRLEKAKMPDVQRKVSLQVGLPNADIFQLVMEVFPAAKLYRKADVAAADKVAALGTDYTLDFHVENDQYLALVNFLKRHAKLSFNYLIQVTAVDWTTHFDLITHLMCVEQGHKVIIRTSLKDRNNAEIESVSGLYKAALFQEREVYDFFGIKFKGHPDLRRLFTVENFEGFPLRKDFTDPTRIVKRPY